MLLKLLDAAIMSAVLIVEYARHEKGKPKTYGYGFFQGMAVCLWLVLSASLME